MTIDGTIRVEVLRLTPGVARLRFVVPRGVAVQRGVTTPGDPTTRAREAGNGGSDGAGMEVIDLTLCGQQIVTVRDDIHIGLMDVAATRALLFFDTPETALVKVESARRPRAAGRSSSPAAGAPVQEQALLPFSMPAEAASPENDLRAPRKNTGDADRGNPAPSTIPFPGPGMGEEQPE